jgi:hypothetical protein
VPVWRQPGALIGTVAWVVTVSSPSPEVIPVCNNPLGPTTGAACTVYVSHDYVLLDPTTGALSHWSFLLTRLRRLNSTIPCSRAYDLGELWIKSGLGGSL